MGTVLTIFGIIFLIPFVLVVLFILKLIKKAKDSDWKGKIVDKKINTVEDFDTGAESLNYVLVVDIGTGRNKNVAVSKKLYDECEIGDTLAKPKGTLIPKKINN